MIQIDDAGSGSLIGGTGIGIYDTTNGKYAFKVIPLRYYQNMKYYRQKMYQDQAIKIVKEVFKLWAINKSKEEIHLCSSYIFDKLRPWLKENKISYQNAKIAGPLQELVEKSFMDYLISLGLPDSYLKHTRYAYGFHRLLHWVYADKKKREKLCKTCWKSYQIWGFSDITQKLVTADEQLLCLKCNQLIETGDKAKIVYYNSKFNNQLIIHTRCPKIH